MLPGECSFVWVSIGSGGPLDNRILSIALASLVVSACAGCAKDRDRDVDRLWRAGYGFNNPNPDRVRNGLPPLNFDGSAYQGNDPNTPGKWGTNESPFSSAK